MKKAIILAIPILVFSLIFFSTNSFALWHIEAVDINKFFENLTSRSITIDKFNYPHIVYGGDHLYHAYFNGSGWLYETVDNSIGVGSYASITIDKNNKIHISYYDEINGDLKYATNLDGSWIIETIDNIGDVGFDTSIAVDSNGNVHISYWDCYYGDLKYASNESGIWTIQTIDSIGYVGEYTSIAIDKNNKVHISYYDESNRDLKYATNASGSWVIETIDSTGFVGLDTSIAIDTNDKVHISYLDWSDNALRYATNTSGSWILQTIDSVGYIGMYTSIAIDKNNKVHISYSDAANSSIKYATNAFSKWTFKTIDKIGDVGEYIEYIGKYTSIATDSNNKVHISYFGDGGLKYATNVYGAWIIQTIDSTGYIGEYTSIAIDSNDKVHISYHRDGVLNYATNVSGSWFIETIDNEGSIGEYSSIAVNSNNEVHISYYEEKELKCATKKGTTWFIETIDSGDNIGIYSSIGIDADENIYISYINLDTLMYATNAYSGVKKIKIEKLGNGSGNITSNPMGIECGNDCSKDFEYGTLVTLSVTPDISSTFTGWSGDCAVCGMDSSCQITMDSNKTCTATFTLNQYLITISVNPQEGGSVVCNPNPVDHGSQSICEINVNSGYALQSVGGSCGGTLEDKIYTINPITNACTVEVNLYNMNYYKLVVKKEGIGDGLITSTPKGINCGSDCEEEYPRAGKPKSVTLKVKPDIYSTFLGWGGDCSGVKTVCKVKMDGDRNVIARFGVGNIEVTPDGYDFGEVGVKKSSSAVFTIENTGSGILKVSGIKAVGGDAKMFKVKGGKKVIPPGGSYQFSVTFKPTSVGTKASTIQILSNDPDTPVFEVWVSGEGI